MKTYRRVISLLLFLSLMLGFLPQTSVHAESSQNEEEVRTSVSAELGETPVFDGLTMRVKGDGAWNDSPKAGTLDGVNYWALEPSADKFYMYGAVDDGFLYGGSNCIAVEVTYFDGEQGHFGMSYNPPSGEYRWYGYVKLSGTNTWRTHTFYISDAAMDNQFVYTGYDFRVGVYVDGYGFSASEVLFSKVSVRKADPSEWNTVSAELGEKPVFDGLTMRVKGDGGWNDAPKAGTLDGVNYWALEPSADKFYMFGNVDDDFLYGETDYVEMDVTYFDGDSGFFSLNYGTSEVREVWGDLVKLDGTGTWKTHTFVLDKALMDNNHLAGGYDFRLGLFVSGAGMSPSEVYISKVVVRKAERPVVERDSVSAELGEKPVFDGLTMRVKGDGSWNDSPKTGTLDGVNYWALEPKTDANPDSFYMYGAVDDEFLYDGSNCVAVEVTYFDGEQGHFGMSYNPPSGEYRWYGYVQLEGTKTWKTYTFLVPDAAMNNRFVYDGYDFRVGIYVDGHGFSSSEVLFSKVVVRKAEMPGSQWEYVTAELGEEPVFDGLTMRIKGDGSWNDSPKTGTLDGVNYWALEPKTDANPNSFYLFGDVDDDYLFGETDYVLMDVTYYDGESGFFSLNYGTAKDKEVWGDLVELGGTGKWLTHTFVLDGAVLSNNHLGGGDFRLGLYVVGPGMSPAEVYISKVVVRKAERPKSVTAAIVTDHVGNVFYGADPFDMTLRIVSDFEGENNFTVNYLVKDYNGLSLQKGSWVETFQGPDTKTASLEFLQSITAYGTYALDLQILNEAGEERFSASLPFSRVRSCEQLDWLGACTHFGQGKSDPAINLPMMAKGGIRYLRDEIYWGNVEREKGVYNFSSYDRFIDEAVAAGIEPLLILDYGNALYDGGKAPTSEEAIQAFANYCTALVTHYQGKVKYFEIWNEWNIGLGSVAPADQNGTAYAKLLVPACKAVRAANPDAYILGIAIASTDAQFIGDVLDYPGAYESMDAVVLHPYTHPRKPEGELANHISTITGEFQKRNLEMLPIWITEMGWPTTNENTTVSEPVAAAYGIRSLLYTMANQDKIERFFWYDFQNDGVDRSYTENNFGLIDCWQGAEVCFAAKPGYAAFSAFAALMNGYQFVSQTQLDGDINVYRFADPTGQREDMLVLWTEGTTTTIRLSAQSGNVVTTDLFGNATASTGKDVTVFVSDMPVYLTGNFPAEITGKEAGFSARGQYTVTSGSNFYILVERNAEASQLNGAYELLLPEGWICNSDPAFQAADKAEATSDQLLIQLPANAANGQYTISLKAVGENGEVYYNQYISVTVTALKEYEITPYLYSASDFTKWAVAVKVNNFRADSNKTGTVKLYNATISPKQLLGEASYSIAPNGSQILLFDWENPGEDLYKVTMVATDAEGNETDITQNISFLAAVALQSGKEITTDGILVQNEWADAMPFSLGTYQPLAGAWGGPEDLTATGYLKWDKDNLYLALRVIDDEHFQQATESAIWQGDSIQFSVDPTRSAEPGAEANSQTGLALNGEDGKVYNYQWLACTGRRPDVLPENAQIAITRKGVTTIYEAAIPWECLTTDHFEAKENGTVGFSILVNDNDAGQRKGFLEYMSGIGLGNNVNQFGDLLLVGNVESPVDPDPEQPTEPDPVKPTEPDPVKPTEPTPEQPTEPDPTQPGDPEQPEQPGDPGKPQTPGSPATGDTYPLGILLAAAIFSLLAVVGMVGLLYTKRKKSAK